MDIVLLKSNNKEDIIITNKGKGNITKIKIYIDNNINSNKFNY